MSNHNYNQGNNNYNNSNRRNGGNGNDVSREDFMKVSNWSARCYAEKDLGGKGKVLDCSIAGARNKDGTYGSGDHLDVICLYNKCAMEEANFVGKNIMFDGNYSISDYQKRNGEVGKNRKVYATRVWFSSRQPNPDNNGNNGNNGYRNYNNNNNKGNYQNNGGNRYNNNGYNNSGYNNGNNGYNNNGYNNGNNYQNQNNGYNNGYNSDGYDDFGGMGDDYR